jgi:hypothetical protein
MGPYCFQSALDTYETPYTDEPDSSSSIIPSTHITPPTSPPVHTITRTPTSPSLASSLPHNQDLEKGHPPFYPISPNQPNLTTETHLQRLHPRLFRVFSFIHVSAALLTAVEILGLLYLRKAENCGVSGGGVMGAPTMLLWGLLGACFGSGVGLCFL